MVAAVAAWASSVNAVLFFPAPPVVMLLVAAVCFTAAVVLARRGSWASA